ncbi:MAG: hypothetical protein ACXIU7_10505 [Roseinatronobacter sp.]
MKRGVAHGGAARDGARVQSLGAGLYALALAGLLAVAPALPVRAGTLTLQIAPASTEGARALGLAVALYSLRQDLRAGVDLRQAGQNHRAEIRQSGGGNRVILRQRGQDHAAGVVQTGGQNTQVIVQRGRGAHLDVHQTGGQSGIVLQIAR